MSEEDHAGRKETEMRPSRKRHLLATDAALLGSILIAMALVPDPLTALIVVYTGNPQTVSEISGVAIRLFVFGILLLSVGLIAYYVPDMMEGEYVRMLKTGTFR